MALIMPNQNLQRKVVVSEFLMPIFLKFFEAFSMKCSLKSICNAYHGISWGFLIFVLQTVNMST